MADCQNAQPMKLCKPAPKNKNTDRWVDGWEDGKCMDKQRHEIDIDKIDR